MFARDRGEFFFNVGLLIFIVAMHQHHPELEPWLLIGGLTAYAINRRFVCVCANALSLPVHDGGVLCELVEQRGRFSPTTYPTICVRGVLRLSIPDDQ
jgi:hypothetical protein